MYNSVLPNIHLKQFVHINSHEISKTRHTSSHSEWICNQNKQNYNRKCYREIGHLKIAFRIAMNVTDKKHFKLTFATLLIPLICEEKVTNVTTAKLKQSLHCRGPKSWIPSLSPILRLSWLKSKFSWWEKIILSKNRQHSNNQFSNFLEQSQFLFFLKYICGFYYL